MIDRKTAKPKRGPCLQLPVHPELRKALKVRSATEDRSMAELVHTMLCTELGREDLLMQVPDATPAAR